MPMIIDVAENVTSKIPLLKKDGVTTIIRYDCRLVKGRWKEASNAEIKAILDAGLRVGIVNEGVGNQASAFSSDQGYLDASYSLARAAHRDQQQGSAIYYAVDWDVTAREMTNNVVPHFQGVVKAHRENDKVWTVGCYGSGFCCSVLLDKGLIHPKRAWITCSSGFQGSKAFIAAGREALWQYSCDKNLHGLGVDYNSSPTGDWGWWAITDQPPPSPPPPPPPATAWPDSWGPSTGKASWYSDGTNADMTPVHNATDLSFASLKIPFKSRVRITNQHNGRSCEAVCHDHGPYVSGRIIDLRPKVAELLDMKDAGVAVVKLEKIG